MVAKTIEPDVLIQAHSAVLGMTFYDGAMFPADHRGDAFVALHGSWNRAKANRVQSRSDSDERRSADRGLRRLHHRMDARREFTRRLGTPVGVLVAKDGALLVSDDGGNCVWRVTYAK